ncbi:MAG: hypothetical protein PHD48_10315 [Alphaproteobacteria bacterium]|nr:hypothetical protein [Alphaproteobacteria bacterium]
MTSHFSSIGLSVVALILLTATPAFAYCTPNRLTGVSCASAADKTCPQLGESTMDGNKQNIVVCLGTSSGSNCAAGHCQWKAMSLSEGASVPVGTLCGTHTHDSGLIKCMGYDPAVSCPDGYIKGNLFYHDKKSSNTCVKQ